MTLSVNKSVKTNILTSEKVRFQLFQFFRYNKDKLNTKYLDNLTSISSIEKPMFDNLGNKPTICITDQKSKESYVNYITNEFDKIRDKYNKKEKKHVKLYKISIYYIYSNEEVYNNYLKGLMEFNNFGLSITKEV